MATSQTRPEGAPSPMATTTSPLPTPPPQTPHPLNFSRERLSLPLPLRLPLATTIAALSGFLLGVSHGSQESGLRFRAENAHRFPSTQTGWYLYHKSKNYHMALGGVKEGFKMGGKMGVWVGLYFGVEEFIDRGRAGVGRLWGNILFTGVGDEGVEGVVVKEGSRDFVSSVLAGLGTAGAFSAWNRFPVPTAARVAKMGAKYGLAFGLVQDVLSLVRGRRLGYVEFVKKHTVGVSAPIIGSDGVAATAG